MRAIYAAFLLASTVALSACAEEDAQAPAAAAAVADSASAGGKNMGTTAGQPEVLVHKSASCGCCQVWVEHMQAHGFPVKVKNEDNLGPIKEKLGVPYGKGSCHTAEVAGYFIEGHVPAADVQRLIAEKPKAKGLAVPGMPIGSPGMEQGDTVEAYDVLLVNEDGSTSVYASYPAK